MSHRSFRSEVDPLEARRLLAFAAVNSRIGHLNVTGTTGDDTIVVALGSDGSHVDITMNGTTESFPKSGIRQLRIDGGDGNDTVSIESAIKSNVTGDAGNDSITGTNAPDSFQGGTGDDTLDGGGNNDLLYGGDAKVTDDGNDQLFGRLGSDSLYSGGGNDRIDGGGGRDYADLTAFTQDLTLSLDNVANDGITGQNQASNLFSIESLVGGRGNDSIIGSGPANYIDGASGTNTIFGVGGNDTLLGGTNSSYDGGSGDDQIISKGSGNVSGEVGNDQISVQPVKGVTGHGLIDGGSGNDQLNAQGNGLTVLGESGDDQLTYENDPDDPASATGDVGGGSGNDQLTLEIDNHPGTAIGYQITFDHGANDGVRGAPGMMNFHTDFETVIGASGDDTLDATAMPTGIELQGGETGDDTLIGSAFADTLIGRSGSDSISGGDGNDLLISGGGLSFVNGGAGTDTASVGDDDQVIGVEDRL